MRCRTANAWSSLNKYILGHHMPCQLCGNPGPFVKSHIIPEAFFRVLRQGTDSPLIVSDSPAARPKRSPIGVYDNGILCSACESKFATVDDYGVQVFLKQLDQLFQPIMTPAGSVAYQTTDVDQELLLRFLIATLWRASVSTHSFYRRVQLGPYENIARQVILAPLDPVPSVFGAVLSRWAAEEQSRLTTRGIMDPVREKWDGVNAYRIYFGEIVAYIKVATQPFPKEIRPAALLTNETTTLVARSFNNSKDFASMVHTAKESHRHQIRRSRKRIL